MKTKYVFTLTTAFLCTFAAQAQKNEIKALERAAKKQNPQEIQAAISGVEAVLSNASNAEKIQYYGVKANALTELALKGVNKDQNFASAADAFIEIQKLDAKSKYLVGNEKFQHVKTGLLQSAIADQDKKQFKTGAEKLYKTWLLDKKDYEKLYFAASFAVNGSDFEKALEYYTILKEADYSGEGTSYLAKNVITNNLDQFGSKADRDNAVKFKTHVEPKDEKIPSKRGEIYRNIALILVQDGKTDLAKQAIRDARVANPDDISLLTTEANLYYNEGDITSYKRIIEEAAAKDPNNAELFFNLGVVASNSKDNTTAVEYYKKAISIDPKYGDAYLNLAIAMMADEEKIVNEMNNLGNSKADNIRYDKLRAERMKMFENAMPYLEQAMPLLKSGDQAKLDAQKVLLDIYQMLELDDKYNRLKKEMF